MSRTISKLVTLLVTLSLLLSASLARDVRARDVIHSEDASTIPGSVGDGVIVEIPRLPVSTTVDDLDSSRAARPAGSTLKEPISPLHNVIVEKLKTEEKVKLDLFVMSKCPFGVRAEQALAPILEEFEDRIDFALHFIASEDGNGEFTSLHGQAEVEEDIRQVVMAKYYPDKYLNYIVARADSYQSDAWEPLAASAGTDADLVKRIASSAEGKEFFRENLKKGRELGIDASPTLLIDNEKYIGKVFALPASSTDCQDPSERIEQTEGSFTTALARHDVSLVDGLTSNKSCSYVWDECVADCTGLDVNIVRACALSCGFCIVGAGCDLCSKCLGPKAVLCAVGCAFLSNGPHPACPGDEPYCIDRKCVECRDNSNCNVSVMEVCDVNHECTGLATPNLVLPASGAVIDVAKPTLTWTAAAGALSYQIQIDRNANFSSPTQDARVNNTTYLANPLANVSYFWRVRSLNGESSSPWSEVRPFTVHVPHADIDIQKTVDNPIVPRGGTAVVTTTVKNTGDFNLNDVTISDDACNGGNIGGLIAGQTYSYSCTVKAMRDLSNVATAIGTPPPGTGNPVSATAEAFIYVPDGVVGSGSPASCNEQALDTELFRGHSGTVRFNCGLALHTIIIHNTKTISINTTIEGGGLITVSGDSSVRVFDVNAGATLNIRNLTVANGLALGTVEPAGGAGIRNSGRVNVISSTLTGNRADYGSAIHNSVTGTVTIINSTLAGNWANKDGGGIYNEGAVKITNSKLSSNKAVGGGGILNWLTGTVTIIDSTLASNSAENGGGIENGASGMVTVTNTTLSNNTATLRGGGIWNLDNGTVIIANSRLFSNMTLSVDPNNPGGGGAIRNITGTVTIKNSALSANRAAYGGGIHNSGGGIVGIQVDVNTNKIMPGASTLSSNFASNDGGGIYNEGTVKITGSALSKNWAVGGGGILNWASGIVEINDSALAHNSGQNGGGIENGASGIVTVTNTTLSNNTATSKGGGIWNLNNGKVTVVNSTLSGNTALASDPTVPAGGGAIRNITGTVTMRNTILLGNQANYGGGIHNSGGGTVDIDNDRRFGNSYTLSGNSATNDGGGIYNEGTLRIANSTLYYNKAIGGAGVLNWGSGSTDINNSTLAFNVAANGGGIENGINGRVTITNTTLSNNSAGLYGGGIVNYVTNTVGLVRIGYSTLAFNSAGLSGGNINNFGGGIVKIARSIVAYSPTGGDCSGTVTSNGYNLLRNVTGCSFDAADGDQVGTETDPLDPRLGPLMNNGAGTQTHAIFSNSPAKDTIPPSECGVATDQRGVPRPQGPQCDMGAYELKQTDPPADP